MFLNTHTQLAQSVCYLYAHLILDVSSSLGKTVSQHSLVAYCSLGRVEDPWVPLPLSAGAVWVQVLFRQPWVGLLKAKPRPGILLCIAGGASHKQAV